MPGLVHRSGCVFHFFHVRGVSQVKLKLKELVSKKLAVGRKVRLWYKRVRRTNVGEGQIYKKKACVFGRGERPAHARDDFGESTICKPKACFDSRSKT